MTINFFSTNNINPFNSTQLIVQNSGQTVPVQNVFLSTGTTTQNTTPLDAGKINALNLKDNLLAKFLPLNFLAKYLNTSFINAQIKKNPKINELLLSKGLSPNINIQNITNITDSHLMPTYNYSKLIMKESGLNFSPEDYSTIEQAALLHDIGKIFIPTEILNKKTNLSQQEREIIDLHDTLGVELLKNTQLSPKVLTLIKSHHDNSKENNNILIEVLKIADIYSALKENRPYKPTMTDEKAFEILYKKAETGEINKKLVTTLEKALCTQKGLQDSIIA